MSLLRSIESRIAQLVEGAFGKAFRSNVQPVELARRLVKEMDDNQQATVRHVYVPNVYEVYLSPQDHGQFEGYEAALTSELAEYLAEHARRNGYGLMSRPKVTLHVDADLEVGAFGIATRTEGAAPKADGPAAASSTMVFRPPPAPVPVAAADGADQRFQVVGPAGPVMLDQPRVQLGRGRHNDVVVHDSSVSREHAEIVQEHGSWVLRDLDSTNGVLVNGARVREQALRPGDRILLGSAELRFDRAQDGAGRR